MNTDNRTNEPTEAQVEAAAKAIWDIEDSQALDPPWDQLDEKFKRHYRTVARAALVAAQGAAPQAESDSVWELIGGALQTPPGDLTGDEYRRRLIKVLEERHGSAPVLPSSTCQHNMVSYTDSVSEKPENFCSLCGYQPSSGVDEDALAEVIGSLDWGYMVDGPSASEIARAVAEWLKGQK